ncbi:MAG: hypothetical protein ACI9IV_000112 [Paracoccaceae bacterium]|jgi:hypothetical protein
MANTKPIFDVNNDAKSALRNQGLAFMLQGASYGLIALVVGVGSIVALIAVGTLLPAESKEAPDPTPNSVLMQPATEQVARNA